MFAMFTLASRGEGGAAPFERNDVILRACPQVYTPEGSRDAPIYKRVAVPARWSLMRVIVKLKSNRFVSTN